MARCLLGFGANLGDRRKTLERSVDVLRGVENVQMVRRFAHLWPFPARCRLP